MASYSSYMTVYVTNVICAIYYFIASMLLLDIGGFLRVKTEGRLFCVHTNWDMNNCKDIRLG